MFRNSIETVKFLLKAARNKGHIKRKHSRSVGRPRLRWMDDVREDLRRMGVTKWRIRAYRRHDWKMVVKEAKVLQGL